MTLKPLTPVTEAELRRLWTSQMTTAKVAEALGMSEKKCRYRAMALNLGPRSHVRRPIGLGKSGGGSSPNSRHLAHKKPAAEDRHVFYQNESARKDREATILLGQRYAAAAAKVAARRMIDRAQNPEEDSAESLTEEIDAMMSEATSSRATRHSYSLAEVFDATMQDIPDRADRYACGHKAGISVGEVDRVVSSLDQVKS